MRERARNESLVAGKVARERADSSEQFLLCPVVSSAGRPVADSMRIVADAEAGSGDHVSPTAVFPSLSVLAKK